MKSLLKIVLTIIVSSYASVLFADVDRENNKQKFKEEKVIKVQGENSTVEKKDLLSRVMIGPYGDKPYKDSGELIINTPSINGDEKLLLRRYERSKSLAGVDDLPRLFIGGNLEITADIDENYKGSTTNDLDLTSAGVGFYAEINSWTSGLIKFSYDNDYGEEDSATQRRVSNSEVYLDMAFITFGDFRKSPFYLTIGQMDLPFGRYSSYMISDPLTIFGNIESRGLVIGYAPLPEENFVPYAKFFLYKSETEIAEENNNIVRDFGGDIGFKISQDDINYNFGVSYISNLADSDTLQENGYEDNGFAQSAESEKLEDRIAAIVIYNRVSYNKWNLLAEYVTAVERFNKNDLSFNSSGAQPTGFNLEGAYDLFIFDRDASFALGFGHTDEALALNLPKKRYATSFSIELMRNTTAKFEFAHNVGYDEDDSAEWNDDTTVGYNEISIGETSNVISAQISIYF